MTRANSLRVFVVDDEPIIAKTLALILETNGFSATAFTDSLEVLKKLETDQPDLLLCDVVMPRLTGIDLAIHVKEVCPDCVVLLLSGQSATADLLRTAEEQGFNFPILAKPIHSQVLMDEIKLHARKPSASA
jgi:CheY-like chemotaxis protein